MHRVLVSACLIGRPVRYNGAHKQSDSDILRRWIAEGRVIAVCPEVAGGLPVPRPPAEIAGGATGDAVLEGRARVVDRNGVDVTAAFVDGAESVSNEAARHGARIAVLKEASPSCGTSAVYDGTFSGARVAGRGVAAARLSRAGVWVFSEDEIAEADRVLRELDAGVGR